METRLYLTIILPEGTIDATARISVSQWEGNDVLKNCEVYKQTIGIAPIDSSKSVVQWTIAALRTAGDSSVADLLQKLSQGQDILMVDTPTDLLF